jgi:hypothetical protein
VSEEDMNMMMMIGAVVAMAVCMIATASALHCEQQRQQALDDKIK